MVAAIGVLGYALAVLRFEAAPLMLGFVLGPLMEENLRRALLLSRGDAMVFIERPISPGFVLAWSLWSLLRVALRAREQMLEAR